MVIGIADFCKELGDILQIDTELNPESSFEGMEEWDSVSFMIVITYFEQYFSKKISFEQLAKCKKVQDVIDLSEKNIA